MIIALKVLDKMKNMNKLSDIDMYKDVQRSYELDNGVCLF